MFKKTLFSILLLSSVALTGCFSDEAENSNTIRIGLDCPMTGTNASFGEQLSYGAKMAIDEINAKGGINGKLIELDIQDDKSDPKEAATIATKWVSDKSIVGTFGYYNSSCGLAALPIINDGKLPTIVTGSSPDISKQNKKYGFRTEPSDLQQATLAGDWMIEDGRKRIAILYESTDYGMGQEKIITEQVKKAGSEVVVSEAYILGETKDFTNILTKVKNANVDAIFLAGVYTEGALIAKQQRTLGMNLPLYSSSSMFEQAFLSLAGEAANGTKVQGVLVPTDPNPIVANFQAAYKEKFGADKVAGTFSAHGYNAIKMFEQAIKAVGTDPDKMVEYLEKMTFVGVTGTISFNETHDIVYDKLTRLVVVDEKFVVE